MALAKHLFYVLLFYGAISLTLTAKRRPLVFVLCLKGFRWDLPYAYSHLPNLHRLATTGSRALWMESEFGGSQTNILSLISGLHIEHHGRRNFIETIPVVNEHAGGHTRLFYWPWFDRQKNHSMFEYLRSGRKSQPEVLEAYVNNGRMSLQRLIKHIRSMFDSLIDENDRTNLIMSFIDEPFTTLARHGINSDNIRRTMLNLDRLIGRLLSMTTKNNINLILLGDHGVEQVHCRQVIYLHQILTQRQLNIHTERYSGTSFSFVFYSKTDHASQYLLQQLRRDSNEKIDIYSNDQTDLPAKLRLPQEDGKPAAIIIIAKPNYYFSYDTEQNPVHCQRNEQNCQPATKADHSDDPRHSSMRTAFLAHGPFFKKGHINEPILITDVYALLRQILCLSPFPSPKGGLFHIHNMLDLTSLSNTCAHVYLSSLNMIKTVPVKPIQRIKSTANNPKLVYVNITETHQIPNHNHIQMHVTVD